MRLVLLFIILLGFAAPVSAGDRNLRGLKDFEILIEEEDLHPHGKSINLTKADLKRVVELKLRLAGIGVLEDSNIDEAIIYVQVAILKVPDVDGYVYCSRLEVLQTTTLFLSKYLADLVSTWNTGKIGISPATSARDDILEAVNETLDEFLIAYLKVNPKTP